MRERLKDRYFIFGAIFVVLGLIILTQLVNLQIIKGKDLDSDSQRRLLNNRPIIAPRGDIEDRNGVPIAVNRRGFIVQVVKSSLNEKELNDMLLHLVGVFEKNGDSYMKSFSKYITDYPYTFGSAIKKLKDPISAVRKEFGVKPGATDPFKTPEDVFRYLMKNKYKIDEKYTDAEAYKIMTLRYEIRDYTNLNPAPVAKDVKTETVAELEERHRDFAGVSTDTEPIRQYIDASRVAQVLGYIRGIDDDEYNKLKNQGYTMTDYIGKCGVELTEERYLKGTNGKRRVEVDTEGHLTEELNSIPSVPGDKVVLTLDMKLQKVAMDSLKRTIEKIKNKEQIGAIKTNIKENFGDASTGSVVALDVNTGEVLAMASYPTYDPSIYLAGEKDKAAQKAIEDMLSNKDSPFTNRAISSRYEPGSTFKPLVGIAGLEENTINAQSKYNDTGWFIEENTKLECMEYVNGSQPHGHGEINLSRALATSCNIFFYRLGMDLGIDKIDKWGKYFGLGEFTGIEIGPESKGIRSNMKYHYLVYPKSVKGNPQWGKVLTAYSSIGQLYNNYTPLQLANYTATIANYGKRYVPHVVKRIIKADGTIEKETKPSFFQVPVKKETIDAVKEGMEAVANSSEGTADEVFADFTSNYHIKVAGKTGTAQTPQSQGGLCSNNGVFICFAPADRPQIAIAVVIEKGVQGRFTAAVAKDILSTYFNVSNKTSLDDIARPDVVELTQ